MFDREDPLAAVASLSYDSSTGEVELVLRTGQRMHANLSPLPQQLVVGRTRVDLVRRTIQLETGHRTAIEMDLDLSVGERGARGPIVYLDQNHWIALARAEVGADQPSSVRSAAHEISALARAAQITLPLSAAHVVEIAKKGARQRTDVAQIMLELSRGWQMRSPLAVRNTELDLCFAAAVGARDEGTVRQREAFTLAPAAIWSDPVYHPVSGAPPSNLPDFLGPLTEQLSWVSSFAEVLLHRSPLVSQEGIAVGTAWASGMRDLAQQLRSNARAKPHRRQLTLTRMLTDMQHDLVRAFAASGLSETEFAQWLTTDAEQAIAQLPALSRVREVLHLRLINADDRWELNDLNDLFFLATAAGYADVVVGEKKTCSYLARVQGQVPAGAAVFHRLPDALESIRMRVAGHELIP